MRLSAPTGNPYALVYPGLLAFLSVVSWATTAGGLWSWFAESAATWVALLAAAAASGFIQVAIAGMWFGVVSREIMFALKPVCLALAVLLSGLSGGLASGSWIMLTAAGELQDLMNELEFREVARPLIDMRDTYAEIAEAMVKISEVSAQREDLEAKHGTSCEGVSSGAGHGPRARMRARIKQEAAQMSGLATKVAERAVEIARLPRDVTDVHIQEAFRAAYELVGDPSTRRLRRWVGETAAGFRQGFLDKEMEVEFICFDREVERMLAAMSALLAKPIEFPEQPPAWVELGFAEAVRQSYGQIWTHLTGQSGSGDEAWDDAAYEASKTAFAIAALVELFIIVLVFLTAALRHGDRWARGPSGAPLPQNVYHDWRDMTDVMSMLVVEEGPHAFFLVPEDGDEELRRRALALARRWKLTRAHAGEALDLPAIAPVHAASVAARSCSATLFSVYVLPDRLLEWWPRALSDLAATNVTMRAEPSLKNGPPPRTFRARPDLSTVAPLSR